MNSLSFQHPLAFSSWSPNPASAHILYLKSSNLDPVNIWFRTWKLINRAAVDLWLFHQHLRISKSFNNAKSFKKYSATIEKSVLKVSVIWLFYDNGGCNFTANNTTLGGEEGTFGNHIVGQFENKVLPNESIVRQAL